MSISYERTGRTNQKSRTRRAIVEAAKALMSDGSEPTVEQAADAAQVSRATAYRYFPNQRELLSAIMPLDAPSLIDQETNDPAVRLDIAVTRIIHMTLENEAALRAMLRLSLDPTGPRVEREMRQGRRIRWVEDALSPSAKRLTRNGHKRLVRAIAATVGIEALVWLTDVAGLSKKEAVDVMRWSAKSLLQAAIHGRRDSQTRE